MGLMSNMILLSICLSFGLYLVSGTTLGAGHGYEGSFMRYNNTSINGMNNTDAQSMPMISKQVNFLDVLLEGFGQMANTIVSWGWLGMLGTIATGVVVGYLALSGSELAGTLIKFILLMFLGSFILGPTDNLMGSMNNILPAMWSQFVIVIFNLMWVFAVLSYLNGADV